MYVRSQSAIAAAAAATTTTSAATKTPASLSTRAGRSLSFATPSTAVILPFPSERRTCPYDVESAVQLRLAPAETVDAILAEAASLS